MAGPGVTEFLALLALLLGGGMIGAGIMKKIKFPTIIGFIIIGMIAGPYGLGIVDDVELINLLAELGIIILLFVVGLEFSLQKLRKAGIKAIIVGMSELSIMFFVAYVGAFSFGWSHSRGFVSCRNSINKQYCNIASINEGPKACQDKGIQHQ